jgi:hypothetical protein
VSTANPTESSPERTELIDEVDLSPLGVGLALAGAGLLLISMFLPLAESGGSFSRVAQNTMIQHSESWALLAFALAIAATVYRAHRSRRPTWAPLILGVWVLGVAIYIGTNDDLLTLCPGQVSLYGPGCERANAGIGVYAAGVAGLLAIAGGWQLRSSSPTPADAGEQLPQRLRKKCPECAELVQPDARVCKHCGFRF